MSDNRSKSTGYLGPNTPWCPTCARHRETTQRDNKTVCSTCYEPGIFTPVNNKVSYVWLGATTVFFLLASAAWGPLSFMFSLVIGAFAYKYYSRHQVWMKWARKERRKEHRERKRRKGSKKESREKRTGRRQKESGRSPVVKPPPPLSREKVQEDEPVPKPPPPPPDFDD